MMLAFQAPPEAVTMPVTRYGKIPGRIKKRQRSQELNRKTWAASLRSVGMAMAPAMTLNRTYHCVPSNMSSMAANSMPPRSRRKNRRMMGKRAVAGTEAAICANGWAIRARRGLKPMATPAGKSARRFGKDPHNLPGEDRKAPGRRSRGPEPDRPGRRPKAGRQSSGADDAASARRMSRQHGAPQE